MVASRGSLGIQNSKPVRTRCCQWFRVENNWLLSSGPNLANITSNWYNNSASSGPNLANITSSWYNNSAILLVASGQLL